MSGIRLTRFGGIAPRIASHNLQAQMATVAENVDLTNQCLRPWRVPRKVSGKVGQFLWKEHCCEIASEDCHASIADLRINCGALVASNIRADGFPAMATVEQACAGQWNRLGFPCTLPAPTANTSTPLKVFTVTDHSAQVRTYKYRLKNQFGQFSQGSYPSAALSLNALSAVRVSLPTTFPPEWGITHVEIFASEQNTDVVGLVNTGGQSSSSWFSVGEVPLGTAIFIDDASNILGDMIDSDEFDPPPDNLRDVQYWRNGQLAGLSGNELVFSLRNHPHAWPTQMRHTFHHEPVKLLTGTNTGYVATKGRPAIVSLNQACNGDGCHSVMETDEPHPIASYRSAAIHNEHGIWATKDGLLMIAPGGQTRLLTSAYYTQDQWRALQPASMIGVVHDGIYYGFTSEIGIRLRLPDSTYDAQDDGNLTTLNFGTLGRPTALYRSDNDELYIQFADGVYWWNEGGSYMTARWRSALHDMPGLTGFSAYKVVHKHADVNVQHWVDNECLDVETVCELRPYRLPLGSMGINWQVDLETTGEICEYHIASSVRDLAEGAAQ